MKRLVSLIALVALAVLPGRAGVTLSVHVGGFHGGGGYHGYAGSCYSGHGYSGGYNGYHGYYGASYATYPSYGYASYGYGPIDDSYPVYSSSSGYGANSDGPVYPYAPPVAPPATANPAAATPPIAAPTAVLATGPIATGKVDDFGFIHSPYSTATFKADKMAPGQVFYDPINGQPFTVQKPAPPSAPAPVPSASLPAGKLDEFGYVHSPFSTFTFKVQNGNFAQVFRDPFTGQSFAVRLKETSPTSVPSVAGPAGAAQASD